MWEVLYSSPWQSDIWQSAFPEYQTCHDDVNDSDSPEYIPNPATTVSGNLIINKSAQIGDIKSGAYKFGDVSNNIIYPINKIDEIFIDVNSGDYRLADIESIRKIIPDFTDIPLDKVGRITP